MTNIPVNRSYVSITLLKHNEATKRKPLLEIKIKNMHIVIPSFILLLELQGHKCAPAILVWYSFRFKIYWTKHEQTCSCCLYITGALSFYNLELMNLVHLLVTYAREKNT